MNTIIRLFIFFVLMLVNVSASQTQPEDNTFEKRISKLHYIINTWNALKPDDCEAFLKKLVGRHSYPSDIFRLYSTIQEWQRINPYQCDMFLSTLGLPGWYVFNLHGRKKTFLLLKSAIDHPIDICLPKEPVKILNYFMKREAPGLFDPVDYFQKISYHKCWINFHREDHTSCIQKIMRRHNIQESPSDIKEVIEHLRDKNIPYNPLILYDKSGIINYIIINLDEKYSTKRDSTSFEWNFPPWYQNNFFDISLNFIDAACEVLNLPNASLKKFIVQESLISYLPTAYDSLRHDLYKMWPETACEISLFFNQILKERPLEKYSFEESILFLKDIFTLFHLNYLRDQRKIRNLENGFAGHYEQNGLTLFWYLQGGWQIMTNHIPSHMPRALIGSVPTKLITKPTFIPCYYDHDAPLGSGLVVTNKGVENNPFLVVDVKPEFIDLIFLNGRNCQLPFSIASTITASKNNPETSDIYNAIMALPHRDGSSYFKAGETCCLAMPETDVDLNILDHLLGKIKEIEGQTQKAIAKTENKVEEIPDEETTSVSSSNVSQLTKKLLKEEHEKKVAELREIEKKTQLKEWEDEQIRKIAEEIEWEENYQKQVVREQEEARRRVAHSVTAAAASAPPPKKQSKRYEASATAAAAAAATTSDEAAVQQETEEQKKARILGLARERFNAKKVTLREVASVINIITKIIPGAKDLLMGRGHTPGLETHKRGSHFGLPQGRLHRPHQGDDGTVYASRATGFVESFIDLMLNLKRLLHST